jgi:hypothetical protein
MTKTRMATIRPSTAGNSEGRLVEINIVSFRKKTIPQGCVFWKAKKL